MTTPSSLEEFLLQGDPENKCSSSSASSVTTSEAMFFEMPLNDETDDRLNPNHTSTSRASFKRERRMPRRRSRKTSQLCGPQPTKISPTSSTNSSQQSVHEFLFPALKSERHFFSLVDRIEAKVSAELKKQNATQPPQ